MRNEEYELAWNSLHVPRDLDLKSTNLVFIFGDLFIFEFVYKEILRAGRPTLWRS